MATAFNLAISSAGVILINDNCLLLSTLDKERICGDMTAHYIIIEYLEQSLTADWFIASEPTSPTYIIKNCASGNDTNDAWMTNF